MKTSKIGSEDISGDGSSVTGAIVNFHSRLTRYACELQFAEGLTASQYTAVKFNNVVFINGNWQGTIVGQGIIATVKTYECIPDGMRYGSGIVTTPDNTSVVGWYRINGIGQIYSGQSASQQWVHGTFSFAYYL